MKRVKNASDPIEDPTLPGWRGEVRGVSRAKGGIKRRKMKILEETRFLVKLINRNWKVVSAYAWKRYLESGRGAVLVDLKDINPAAGGLANYVSHEALRDLQEMPEDLIQALYTYDPARQVLLIILHGNETLSWCTVGKPSDVRPQEAFERFKKGLARLMISNN